MTEVFTFTPARIEHLEEKIGCDIRPAIEMKLDRPHLIDFGNDLTDKYPNLYESTVQSPNQFLAQKRFIFPGKGEAEIITLVVKPSGPLFVFPRVLGPIEEETDLPRCDDIITDLVAIFRNRFTTRKIIRVGLITEYVFSTGAYDSTELVCGRFTKLKVPPKGDLFLKLNHCCDQFNRLITIEPMTKRRFNPTKPTEVEPAGFAIKVTVDFNNRNMTEDLKEEDIVNLMHAAKNYNKKELYEFLNNPSEIDT